MPDKLRKIFLIGIKSFLILGIFVFLFRQAGKDDAFNILLEQPKRWELLLFAFLVQCFAVSITFWRWKFLSTGLGLTLSLKDSFRLGFLGLMLNLAPMGIVGGDAIKAVLLARLNPDKRAEALASVIVDRIIGLLVMFLVGTIFIIGTGFVYREEILANTAKQIVFALTLIGFSGVGIVFLPFFSGERLGGFMERIPFAGKILAKLTRALLIYKDHKRSLLCAFLITFLVHLPFGASLFLIAFGLFREAPGLADHIMLYCVSNLTAMIPLAAGPFELVLDLLYPLFSVHGVPMRAGIGLVVALGFRIISILVAAIGIIFYLSSKADIQSVRENQDSEVDGL